jgi:predicted NBD/HSP70 family sugar kinase
MDYLVVDVGGSAIKYALMNDKAEFLEKGQVKTPMESIEQFTEIIGGIFDKYKDNIEGMAMSMPGIIDSNRGYAHTGGALLYNYDKDIVSILKKRCLLRLKMMVNVQH